MMPIQEAGHQTLIQLNGKKDSFIINSIQIKEKINLLASHQNNLSPSDKRLFKFLKHTHFIRKLLRLWMLEENLSKKDKELIMLLQNLLL